MTIESTIAGTWYPGTEKAIRALAEIWEKPFCHDASPSKAIPNVLILPHAGWTYSGEVAWKAVRTVRGAKFRRIVILAPSHRAWIENRLVAPEADSVATPLGTIKIDKAWLDRLAISAPVARNDRIHAAEHAAQIEYPLLQLALGPDISIVPLVMGMFGADQVGMCARALAQLMDDRTLLVISSDFTHYGEDFSYAPYGTKAGEDVRKRVAAVDDEAFSFISACDADGFVAFLNRTGATICGHVPIELSLRAISEGSSFSRLAYATSGDNDRDFSRFVCYVAATGHAVWKNNAHLVLDGDSRDFLFRIARESIECAVRGERKRGEKSRLLASAPKAVLAKMGAFVTLNDRTTGALRGCIGEILPMRPLAEAVAVRAVDAALHDPRFMPVTERELGGLRIEVSALTPPERVSSWRDIVLGRDGVTLEKNGHFAVFLPQVAPEQGWDMPTTLSHLSLKAGLNADAWREGAPFETFRAEVFHE